MPRYASTTDLARLGLRAEALASIPTATQEAALDAQSAIAAGYIASRKKLPLTSWGDDLRSVVARMSMFELLATRGYDPNAGNDEVLRLRFEDAMRWLRDFAAGRTESPEMVDATPASMADEGTTYARSTPRRRWIR